MYFFILVSVFAYEYYLDVQLNQFDLDGDGIFTGQENTLEQAKAMAAVTNDTGRTFAPITGAIYSVLYFLVVFIVWWVSSTIRNLFTKATNQALKEDADNKGSAS